MRPRSPETSPVRAILSPLMATPPAVQGEPVPSQIRPFLKTTSKSGWRVHEMSVSETASRRRMRRIVRNLGLGIEIQPDYRPWGGILASVSRLTRSRSPARFLFFRDLH